MVWVVVPFRTTDVWVDPPGQWRVVAVPPQFVDRQGWALLVWGREGAKDHQSVRPVPSWLEVRWFESVADATYLRDLLNCGQVPPGDALSWSSPGGQAIGEVVESVADIHRRMRRRR